MVVKWRTGIMFGKEVSVYADNYGNYEKTAAGFGAEAAASGGPGVRTPFVDLWHFVVIVQIQ